MHKMWHPSKRKLSKLCSKKKSNLDKTDTSESYFRVKLKEWELWQDLQLSGVLEFWKLEMGDRKYLLYGLWAERECKTIPLPALKSYGWWVGGWLVSCDYSVSSAPFGFELKLWEWNLEVSAEMSRSRAWQ